MTPRRYLLLVLFIAIKLVLVFQFAPGEVVFTYEGF